MKIEKKKPSSSQNKTLLEIDESYSIKVSYNPTKKHLKCDIKDAAFRTPFQPHLIADILNNIYKLTAPDKETKFEYFKDDNNWGFIVKGK